MHEFAYNEMGHGTVDNQDLFHSLLKECFSKWKIPSTSPTPMCHSWPFFKCHSPSRDSDLAITTLTLEATFRTLRFFNAVPFPEGPPTYLLNYNTRQRSSELCTRSSLSSYTNSQSPSSLPSRHSLYFIFHSVSRQ